MSMSITIKMRKLTGKSVEKGYGSETWLKFGFAGPSVSLKLR